MTKATATKTLERLTKSGWNAELQPEPRVNGGWSVMVSVDLWTEVEAEEFLAAVAQAS